MIRACLVTKDPAVIDELAGILGGSAETMTICRDRELALGMMARQHFDGVFVDFDGLSNAGAIVEALRRSESHRNVVCGVITSNTTIAVAAFQAGATLVIDKPLTADRSRRTLQLARSLMLRERRRYYRESAFVPVMVSTPTKRMEATSVNISESGMCIWSPAPLAPGCDVHLRFALPPTAREHHVLASVAWSEPSGKTGLQFKTVPRLTQLVLSEWLAQSLLKQCPNPESNSRRPYADASVAVQ